MKSASSGNHHHQIKWHNHHKKGRIHRTKKNQDKCSQKLCRPYGFNDKNTNLAGKQGWDMILACGIEITVVCWNEWILFIWRFSGGNSSVWVDTVDFDYGRTLAQIRSDDDLCRT